MKLIGEAPEDLTGQFEELRSLSLRVSGSATPRHRGMRVPPGSDLLLQAKSDKAVYILRGGVLTLNLRGVALAAYAPGDLVGLEHALSGQEISIVGDLEVTVDEYDLSAVLQLADRSGVSVMAAALGVYAGIFLSVYSGRSSDAEGLVSRRVRSFAAGATIIKQGDKGADIYTMVTGTATVLVDGEELGEILPDEVFGALAALGQIPRTATVIAKEPCLVLVIERERLIDLIRHRPAVIERMIFDLATVVQELSSAVVEAKRRGRSARL